MFKVLQAVSGLEALLADPFDELMDVVGESASEGGEFEKANEQPEDCEPVGEGVTGLSISVILAC